MKTRIPSFLITFSLACFVLLAKMQAVSPPPDGGYLGGNTAEGDLALLNLTGGLYNTAVGIFSLLSLNDGNFNTAVGAGTLLVNTSDDNTATGAGALLSNTIGIFNTANGAFALFNNSVGSSNTAVGFNALFNNTTGDRNTATGDSALLNNTIGTDNTASGFVALDHNTTGSGNTATGSDALFSNTEGSSNTATGSDALIGNTTGDSNTANGNGTLFSNTIGDDNTAVGFQALAGNTIGDDNAAVGFEALAGNTTGNNNTAIGTGAGSNQTIGNSNVYIGQGMAGVAGENNTCYIASIFGQISTNGVAVLVNSDNKLGTNPSSKRFKQDIKPMDKASEEIYSLRPVSFRYKRELDPAGTSQLGLVAEEVENVNPDLIVRDKEGKPYSVRYDQVNAMLLNEFLKEHRRVAEQANKLQEQEATIVQLKKQIQTIVAHSKEQDARLQTVNDQVQMNRPATRVAAENP
jgi:trimeric autotransporter adhesin